MNKRKNVRAETNTSSTPALLDKSAGNELSASGKPALLDKPKFNDPHTTTQVILATPVDYAVQFDGKNAVAFKLSLSSVRSCSIVSLMRVIPRNRS